MVLDSHLYSGVVKHYRTRPKKHALSYRLFLFLVNLSEIDELTRRVKILSRNRFNLFSFYDKDFGESGLSLNEYLSLKLSDAGLASTPQRVQLLCSVRILGYCFNPLSVFYCYDSDDNLYATVYEVHNTRGERHTYVLSVSKDASTGLIAQHCEKAMYVSPFVPPKMNYEFTIKQPDESLSLTIKVGDKDGTMVGAMLTGVRSDITTGNLTKHFFMYPLVTLKVIVGIHYEALKLWLKGVQWFKYLPKSRLYADQSEEQ